MQEHHYQLIGLIGFIAAGVIFVAVGIRADDVLTVLGSVVWIMACLVWMIPLLKTDENSS